MKGGLGDYIDVVEGIVNLFVVSCDGVYSEVLSKRFDSDVEGFLRALSGGYILEEVVLISDGNFSGGKCVYSVSRMCTRLSLGCSLTVLIAVGCL